MSSHSPLQPGATEALLMRPIRAPLTLAKVLEWKLPSSVNSQVILTPPLTDVYAGYVHLVRRRRPADREQQTGRRSHPEHEASAMSHRVTVPSCGALDARPHTGNRTDNALVKARCFATRRLIWRVGALLEIRRTPSLWNRFEDPGKQFCFPSSGGDSHHRPVESLHQEPHRKLGRTQ